VMDLLIRVLAVLCALWSLAITGLAVAMMVVLGLGGEVPFLGANWARDPQEYWIVRAAIVLVNLAALVGACLLRRWAAGILIAEAILFALSMLVLPPAGREAALLPAVAIAPSALVGLLLACRWRALA
jgi:hypothetical protein